MIPTVKLYRGDCLDILKRLPAGSVDAVVTVPPYGIGLDTDYTRFSLGLATNRNHHRGIPGDSDPFDPAPWLQFGRIVMWGANFYSNKLPGGGWLVWCKKRDNQIGKFLGDCEVAWFRPGKAVYLFHHVWNGFDRASDRGRALHPTQKPVALMRWCIERLKLKPGATILDPYMGSGPVGIAAVQLGFNFIGIEIDPEYHAIAKRRIAEARKAALLTHPSSLIPHPC